MIQQATASTEIDTAALWPKGVGIEVLGLTGDFASGKTLFGLTICPGKETLVFDVEKSTATYQSLGFERVDLPAVMMKKHGGATYRPVDMFITWLEMVRAIKPGQYRVIMLDPVSEIENGLVDWVRENPKLFGYSAGQFQMGGFLWGAVKDYWKSILADIATRCETFVFTSHLRTVWKGGTPTGQKAAKGKETLMEMASLYLHLERKKDAKGNTPDVPSAVVLKSRLAETIIVDGKVTIRPYLPPRLPVATPDAIRQYIITPPDYSHLKKAELAPEEVMTEDDRLVLRANIAQAEAQAEASRLERLQRATSQSTLHAEKVEQAKREQAAAAVVNNATTTTAAAATPTTNGQAANGDEAHPFGDAPLESDLKQLQGLKKLLSIDDDTWKAILAKRNATRAMELTQKQAADLVAALKDKLEVQRRKEASATTQQPATTAAGN